MDIYIETKLETRWEDGRVIIEPPPVHGVRGFTLSLSPDAAKKLGYRLVSESIHALSPTCGGKS